MNIDIKMFKGSKRLLTSVAATSLMLLAGCDKESSDHAAQVSEAEKVSKAEKNSKADKAEKTHSLKSAEQKSETETENNSDKITSSEQKLASILAKQPESVKDRYAARNPQQTLSFFGIEPGMTVVEALPGGGWYSKILLPYLGENGTLIGADYAADMFPLFGFFDDEFIASKKTWVKDWVAGAEKWRSEDSAKLSAFQFGAMPDDMKQTADAVLFIRALHNLKRFEQQGQYLTTALDEAYAVLKPGGVLGVVQHMAPESHSDEWAGGQNGYLKKSFLIERITNAGFEFVDVSNVNINPKDNPTEKDMVWRLPPSLVTSKENPELKQQMMETGESTRITLLFKKPE